MNNLLILMLNFPKELSDRFELDGILLVGIPITQENLRLCMDQMEGLLGYLGTRLGHYYYNPARDLWMPAPESPHKFSGVRIDQPSGVGRIRLEKDDNFESPIGHDIILNVRQLPVFVPLLGKRRDNSTAGLYVETGKEFMPQSLVYRERHILFAA